MKRMRFPIATVAAAALNAATPAHAQAPAARIDDIQVSREGETVSILVKLSQQPAAASAKAAGDDLVVEIDGIDLAKLTLEPPSGSLMRRVEAGGRKLALSGAAFGEASTVIYRNAVLIEAKLAEPRVVGASLMTSAPSPPAPVKPPSPPARPLVAEQPAAPKAAEDKSIDLLKNKDSQPAVATAKPQTPAAKPSALKASAAGLAGIDTARCAAAAVELEKDAWAVQALGDHALCLIDQDKPKDAGSKLEQLAAFAPEDWRISLGRAVLAAERGDTKNAEVGYRAAASSAPTETIRAAITRQLGGKVGAAP
jgi:hypothetical protein